MQLLESVGAPREQIPVLSSCSYLLSHLAGLTPPLILRTKGDRKGQVVKRMRLSGGQKPGQESFLSHDINLDFFPKTIRNL